VNDREKQQAAAIEDEFPAWEAWVTLHGQWRVRLKHSEPVVMLFDDTPEGLRGQVREWIAKHP
jgi:hypothetical protein